MGLFLVIGAGVDYSIFQWEHRGARGNWTRLGIYTGRGYDMHVAWASWTELNLSRCGLWFDRRAWTLFLSLAFSPLVALGFPSSKATEIEAGHA